MSHTAEKIGGTSMATSSWAGHLTTVSEMFASIGDAHSARNLTRLLTNEGLAACFADLTYGSSDTPMLTLNERIRALHRRLVERHDHGTAICAA